jgi:hypothetical protein
VYEFPKHYPDEPGPPQALELRVHGVSGTPPQDLLDRPLVEQVAGDKIAGFYRPRLQAERVDARPSSLAPERPGAPLLEGYNWGGLTSGSPGRALWLPLLPFTLVNLAPRARPPQRDRSWTTVAIWYLSRLLALLLTMLLVLAAAGVGEDLVAWQCGGDQDRCAKAAPHWLFRHLIGAHRLSAEHLLLIGAAVPVLVLAFLWKVSARTANRYESTVADLRGYHDVTDVEHDGETNALEVGLASRLMWRNEWQVRRLRAVHLQSGFAVILWTVLAPTGARWVGIGAAAVLAYGAVVLAVPSYTGHGKSTPWRIASGIVWAVLAVMGVVEIVGLGWGAHWLAADYLTDPNRGALPAGALPFYGPTVLVEFTVALGVLVLLILVVALAAIAQDRSEPPAPHRPLRPGLGGMVSAVFAALGVFLGASFGAGIYTYAATWLHTGSVKPGFGDVAKIYQFFVVPDAVRAASEAYAWAVLVFAGLLVVGLVVFALAYGALGRRVALVPDSAVTRDYGADAAKTDPKRAKQIERAIFFGRLVDCAPWILAPLVTGGVVIVTVFGVQALTVPARDRLVGEGTPPGFFSADSLRGAGAYFAVLTLLGLVSLGSLAFRAQATRRSVGILWDVASFWPRACHPLAAPCYAERTVPDLITRISAFRVADPRNALVLAAHSQGTVITAAALVQLGTYDTSPQRRVETRVLPGVAFLSFGCVLRRLYGRFFPVYFGPHRLADVQRLLSADGRLDEQQPRWRNLWRYTDYLGGQVTAGPPPIVPDDPSPVIVVDALFDGPPVTGPTGWEWHSPDPPRFARPEGDTTFAPPHRHSDFWLDPSGYFQLAAADLLAGVQAESPARPFPRPRPMSPPRE